MWSMQLVYIIIVVSFVSVVKSFNPRPPQRTGAALAALRLGRPQLLFQSSPAPEDGRCSRDTCSSASKREEVQKV